MENPADHRFLPFFLREPVYVVDEPEPVAKSPTRTVPDLPCLGSPQSDILIIAHEPDHEFLSASDQAFLEKILQAVSLTTEEVTVINGSRLVDYHRQGFSTDELLIPFAYRIVWALSDLPNDWSLRDSFQSYAVSEADGRRLLRSDPLSAIADSVDKKGRLWKCLQTLFAESA